MLDFERRVTAALTTSDDPDVRAGTERFVGESLQAMPAYLRAGVLAPSLVFGLVHRVRPHSDVGEVMRQLEGSRIPLVGQYVRLFRSLVLFAEQELEPVATALP